MSTQFNRVHNLQRDSAYRLNKMFSKPDKKVVLKVPEKPKFKVPNNFFVPLPDASGRIPQRKQEQIQSLNKTLSVPFTLKQNKSSNSDLIALLTLKELKEMRKDNNKNLQILKGEIESGNNNSKVLKEYEEAERLKRALERQRIDQSQRERDRMIEDIRRHAELNVNFNVGENPNEEFNRMLGRQPQVQNHQFVDPIDIEERKMTPLRFFFEEQARQREENIQRQIDQLDEKHVNNQSMIDVNNRSMIARIPQRRPHVDPHRLYRRLEELNNTIYQVPMNYEEERAINDLFYRHNILHAPIVIPWVQENQSRILPQVNFTPEGEVLPYGQKTSRTYKHIQSRLKQEQARQEQIADLEERTKIRRERESLEADQQGAIAKVERQIKKTLKEALERSNLDPNKQETIARNAMKFYTFDEKTGEYKHKNEQALTKIIDETVGRNAYVPEIIRAIVDAMKPESRKITKEEQKQLDQTDAQNQQIHQREAQINSMANTVLQTIQNNKAFLDADEPDNDNKFIYKFLSNPSIYPTRQSVINANKLYNDTNPQYDNENITLATDQDINNILDALHFKDV